MFLTGFPTGKNGARVHQTEFHVLKFYVPFCSLNMVQENGVETSSGFSKGLSEAFTVVVSGEFQNQPANPPFFGLVCSGSYLGHLKPVILKPVDRM